MIPIIKFLSKYVLAGLALLLISPIILGLQLMALVFWESEFMEMSGRCMDIPLMACGIDPKK